MGPRALKVATIDDDPVDRMMVRRLLEQDAEWQVETLEFPDGETAVRDLPGCEVDVILLDYELGSTDGIHVLHRLRDANVEAPIVALTGQGDESVAVDLLKAGASDYIPKGRASTVSLRRAISNAIEKQSLRRAVQRYRENLETRNAELEQQKRDIEAFYHTLSHELKTPLTSVREFVCLLSDGVAGPVSDEQQEFLGYARRGCDQLTRLMNDLIDLSRLDTGKFSLECTEVPLGAVIDDVVHMEAGRVEAAGLSLSVDGDPGTVRADRERVKQVLTNLLDNAVKFTPEGGSITIEVATEDERTRVAVRDTGRGVAEEQRARIFERHHQATEEDCNLGGGMGLGLHLCRQLIELQGGEIWYEEPEGAGSRFCFTLPAVLAEPVPA